jgi:tRNA-dihydrouridine synthase
MARPFEEHGVEAIIYTDIARDGMMQGVNVEATAKLARAINIPVISSGGITNMDDIHALGKVAEDGIMGAITGRAIYEGTLDFAVAEKLAASFSKFFCRLFDKIRIKHSRTINTDFICAGIEHTAYIFQLLDFAVAEKLAASFS